MYDVSQIQNLQKFPLLSMLITSQITQAQTLLEGSCSDEWPFLLASLFLYFLSSLVAISGPKKVSISRAHPYQCPS
jgi:hypothetical protein